MNPRRLLLVLVASVLVTPLKPAPAQSAPDSMQQITTVRDEWIRDWKTNNLEDLRTLYAQDALFMPAVGTWINGPDAIGNYLEQIIDSSGGLIVKGSGEVSWDLAYDSGFIQYWIKGNNGPVKGSYVMVLKRDSEGKWHIVRHAITEISTRYSSPPK